eukprot:SAG31_NODE_4505_length_3179_cov_61.458766_2_plen_59_part_00
MNGNSDDAVVLFILFQAIAVGRYEYMYCCKFSAPYGVKKVEVWIFNTQLFKLLLASQP